MIKVLLSKRQWCKRATVMQCKAKDSESQRPCSMIQVDLLRILKKLQGISQVKAIGVSEKVQSEKKESEG